MLTNTEISYGGAVGTPARLGPNHGYRIDGDIACLNAELSISREAAARSWALQLWACDAPYDGGALAGIKVAEAPLDLASEAQPQCLYSETFAGVPAGSRDYAMVLVLASGQSGAFDRVHDYANYPARERFLAPRLCGEVSYAVDGDRVSLQVERLHNPRSADNLSGSLALELWALSEAYGGGPFSGYALAGVELGTLAGQSELELLGRCVPYTQPPAAGRWQAVVMLREWTGSGYRTRDFRNFGPLHASTVASSAPLAPESAPTKPGHDRRSEHVTIEPAPQLPDHEPAVSAGPSSTPESVELRPPARAAEPLLPTAERGLVSIQHATLDELAQAKGLNRKLAAEIIKGRPYSSVDDLLKVRGIGDKMLRKLRSELKL